LNDKEISVFEEQFHLNLKPRYKTDDLYNKYIKQINKLEYNLPFIVEKQNCNYEYNNEDYKVFKKEDKLYTNFDSIKNREMINFNSVNPHLILEDKVKKFKILIVDDHKFIRESLVILIKKTLKGMNKEDNYEIIEGSDGVEILSNLILDQTQENEIKYVITDENMEYINGSEAISIIRKLEKAKKIKNIVIASITAFEDEYNKNKIKQSGADIILSKPCSEVTLKKFFTDFNELL